MYEIYKSVREFAEILFVILLFSVGSNAIAS